MGKYVEALKIQYKTQIAYRFDTISSMVFTIAKILLAYILWGAIFTNKTTISGFTFNSMLFYYIISSFIAQLDQSTSTGWQIANEIRNGAFSKYIIKPINIFGYLAAQTVGVSAFLLSFNLFASLIWIFVFSVDITISSSTIHIISSIGFIVLGLFFMMQLNYFAGILAFKFLDTTIFMMLKDNIVQFIAGSLIPLILLPAEIVHIMTYFPFYYIAYLPTMLLLGRNGDEITRGFIVIILWNIILWFINKITYKKLKSNYDGVGI